MAAFPLAIVLKGYPRLSETFIAQEILALERAGIDVRLYSLRLPTDPAVHPVHREIRAPVVYLPEYLHHAAAARAAGMAGDAADCPTTAPRAPRCCATCGAIRTATASAASARRWCWRHELPADTGWLHAHFLHTPASVARYAAMLRGLPWSVSAHAKDVWTIPDWEKREKLADCRWR